MNDESDRAYEASDEADDAHRHRCAACGGGGHATASEAAAEFHELDEFDEFDEMDELDEFEASEFDEAEAEAMQEAAVAANDRRRRRVRRAPQPAPLPFQFQVPIGGGSPALSMPIGGAASPFAFSLPLGGTPPPAPAPAPYAAGPYGTGPYPASPYPGGPYPTGLYPSGPYAAPGQPTGVPGMVPPAAMPAAAAAGVPALAAMPGDAPLVLAGDQPLYVAPESDDREASTDLLSAAESLDDDAVRSASDWLHRLLARSARGGAGVELALSPFGADGPLPSATALFNAFVYPGASVLRDRRLAAHYARRFEVIARPGDPADPLALRAGDLLIRVALGQGYSHLAVLASPSACWRDDLPAWQWQGEGHPRPVDGLYLHVVERLPRRRRAAERFARRFTDARARVLPDTLLLRPVAASSPARPAVSAFHEHAFDEHAFDEQVAAGPDSTVADRFIAAHASRWCTPGQAGSATCRGLPTPRPIRRVVIHVLAVPSTSRRSGAEAVVAGWQNAGRTASSHYIVDRDGTITQMVREADVAFHTPSNNADSIGIEHADVCNDPAPLTDRLYERSAALVRDLATRHGFALDAAHVAGHHDVNPNHGDPGPYWDWEFYRLLLGWNGTSAGDRPRRFVASMSAVAAPAGWQRQRRRTIANDHCASGNDPWGATYWRASRCAAGTAVAETSVVIDEAGTYKVSLWWPRVSGANAAAPVDIEVACLASPCVGASTQSVTVDQRSRPGRWNDVAVIQVTQAPSELKVRWRCPPSRGGFVVADGVRALKIASSAPPPLLMSIPGETDSETHAEDDAEKAGPAPENRKASCAYFFKGADYVRYDIKADAVNAGPVAIGRYWRLPADFQDGLDAVVNWGNGLAYFFKGNRYLRYNITSDRVDVAPRDIYPAWSALPEGFRGGFDAVVNWGNGKAYFFKGEHYLRYDIGKDLVDVSPRSIISEWTSMPPYFQRDLDAVLNWGDGNAYFFKGDQYLRWDIATDRVDVGPTPVAREWTSLPAGFQTGLHAAVNWSDPCDLAEFFRNAGLTVVEETNWRTRGGAGFNPEGIMIHHTGGSFPSDLGIVINGRPATKTQKALAGPLANFYVPRGAALHLVAARTANHGGRGAHVVLDEVRRNIAPSGSAAQRGLKDGADRNSRFYGFECENDGLGQDWPAAQLDTMARAAAALCQRHCWNQNRVIGHLEWTSRKPDPVGFSMDDFRRRVASFF